MTVSNKFVGLASSPSLAFTTSAGKRPTEFFTDFVGDSASETTNAGTWKVAGDASPLSLLTWTDSTLNLVTGATSTNGNSISLTGAPFRCGAGRALTWAARVKTPADSAVGSILFVGLVASGTTAADMVAATAQSHIGFVFTGTATDAGYTLSASSALTAAESTVATGLTLGISTWVTLMAIWDGLDSVRWYVDGSLVRTHSTAANIPIDTNLTFGAAAITGENKLVSLGLDYAYVGVEHSTAR